MTTKLIIVLVSLFARSSCDPRDGEVKVAHSQDCRSLLDGVYADPSDCHRYFQCTSSKAFYFRCYDGFVFDPCDLRCKMRDACIPMEMCSKNLQNLTLNMYRMNVEAMRHGLNDLQQNDADPAPPQRKSITITQPRSTGNTGNGDNRKYIMADTIRGSLHFSPSLDPHRRAEISNVESSNPESSLPFSAPRLPVVRSLNSVEPNPILKPVVHSEHSIDGPSLLVNTPTVAIPLAYQQDDKSSSVASTDVFGEFHPYLTSTKGPIQNVALAGSKQIGAEARITDKPIEIDQRTENIFNRSGQALTGAPPTTVGTTEATMTYIVKVVFSKRGKPDSQKTSDEEENSLAVPTTTVATSTATSEATTTLQGELSTATDSARLKTVETTARKSQTPANITLSPSDRLRPLDKAETTTTSFFNVSVPQNDLHTTSSSGSFLSTTNVGSTVSSERSVSIGIATNASAVEGSNATGYIETTTMAHEKITPSAHLLSGSSSASNQSAEEPSQTPSFLRITSEVITVTLNPTPRIVNGTILSDGHQGLSNITLSCNPTISSAYCEKSDNQTREALAHHCQQIACNNGGMYISLSNGHCGCVCPTGYKGETCLDISDRKLCNCANGGKCIEVNNDTFACRCPLGYLGNRCQYPVDDVQPKLNNLYDLPPPGVRLTSKVSTDLNRYLLCMVNHCANGGICLKEIETGVSQCFCIHNFAGQFCEKKCINC